jgi:hypothetical protein
VATPKYRFIKDFLKIKTLLNVVENTANIAANIDFLEKIKEKFMPILIENKFSKDDLSIKFNGFPFYLLLQPEVAYKKDSIHDIKNLNLQPVFLKIAICGLKLSLKSMLIFLKVNLENCSNFKIVKCESSNIEETNKIFGKFKLGKNCNLMVKCHVNSPFISDNQEVKTRICFVDTLNRRYLLRSKVEECLSEFFYIIGDFTKPLFNVIPNLYDNLSDDDLSDSSNNIIIDIKPDIKKYPNTILIMENLVINQTKKNLKKPQ